MSIDRYVSSFVVAVQLCIFRQHRVKLIVDSMSDIRSWFSSFPGWTPYPVWFLCHPPRLCTHCNSYLPIYCCSHSWPFLLSHLFVWQRRLNVLWHCAHHNIMGIGAGGAALERCVWTLCMIYWMDPLPPTNMLLLHWRNSWHKTAIIIYYSCCCCCCWWW